MQGKVVVITGATSGIGEIAAGRLAQQGARLLLVARDPRRARATLTQLNSIARDPGHRFYEADLSRLSEMKRVAGEIARAEPRIDVLINNAGAVFGSRQLTEDNLERTFAINHMAYFALTLGLRDRLLAAAPARIVNTASDAHKGAKLDFDDLQAAHGFAPMKAYGRSKLCNILFTRELGRRLRGQGVTANCLHPGFVATRIGDDIEGFTASLFRLAKYFALTPEQGAETIVYLASSPDVADSSGEYFYKCRTAQTTVEARNDEDARRLWTESAKLSGIEAY
jgi:NAD(P)-dependent dehydrogenase (short-subunit alcohol dehydrogenase family)